MFADIGATPTIDRNVDVFVWKLLQYFFLSFLFFVSLSLTREDYLQCSFGNKFCSLEGVKRYKKKLYLAKF